MLPKADREKFLIVVSNISSIKPIRRMCRIMWLVLVLLFHSSFEYIYIYIWMDGKLANLAKFAMLSISSEHHAYGV